MTPHLSPPGGFGSRAFRRISAVPAVARGGERTVSSLGSPSPCGRGAGGGAAATTLLLAALLLGARAPLTAEQLRLPADAFPGIREIETRGALVDDGAPLDGHPQAAALRALRARRVASAANFRYRLAPPAAGEIKVRVDVLADLPAAERDWSARHLPQAMAMTRPLAGTAADAAWIFRDSMAGLRLGNVIVEIRSQDGTAELEAFARRYAGFVRDRRRA